MRARYRSLSNALLALASFVAFSSQPERAAGQAGVVQRLNDRQQSGEAARWVGTWTASPSRQGYGPRVPPPPPPVFPAQTTFRQIVHVSIGGHEVRVQFSNQFGYHPLVIGAAHVARTASGGSIVPGTDRALTFNGASSITIAPDEDVLSDPVALDISPLSDLSVSIYLPEATAGWTLHGIGLQRIYFAAASGNYTDAADLPIASADRRRFFLTAVHVAAVEPAAAIVNFGDSWVDANGSTPDANHRYTDVLAARLQAEPELQQLGVLNAGISGNRLLYDRVGLSGLSRFDRDVLAQPGIKYVIVGGIGGNDIDYEIPFESVTVEEIIAGYQQLILRAHARGLRIYGATMIPDIGANTDEKEAKRLGCNEWIRHGGAFDAVIDWDEVLRDPSNPRQLLPAYLIGTNFVGHPNDAGNKTMADAIPLSLFR